MSKIRDLIDGLEPDQAYFSYEFFPPKTRSGMANLDNRLARMALLGPLFVTVTWGAGGSTSSKSLELAELCHRKHGLTTCLHLTCTNMKRDLIDHALDRARTIGIRNILALRGDEPRSQEYAWNPEEVAESSEFSQAVDLVRYIRQRHGDYFCIGVAAYPEGHVEGSSSSESSGDVVVDLPFLVEKVKAGADFIVTQLFYDVGKFLTWETMVRQEPKLKKIPIIPGLMPINTYQTFMRATRLSHASVPQWIQDRIPQNDDEKVKEFGINLLCEIVAEIRNSTGGRIRGTHFYTLNLEKSVALVLERSKLLHESAIEEEDRDDQDNTLRVPPGHSSSIHRRRASSADNKILADKPHSNVEATYQDALMVDENPVEVSIAISSGEGSLGKEATWDEFPNGRFGSSRSPAFGELLGYGSNGLKVAGKEALRLWGRPETLQDLITLFTRYLEFDLAATPWSEQPFSIETTLIQEELILLNQKGYLTMTSQPATNAVPSNDKFFGWGPAGGVNFQKSFVEFFVSHEEWTDRLKPKLDADTSGQISYYEGTHSTFSTNLAPHSSNVVTWGVFPNREIVQSTIVEEDSFVAWKDEAFKIWHDWQRFHHPDSATTKLLAHIHDTYHLVSVLHHDFTVPDALWQFLLD